MKPPAVATIFRVANLEGVAVKNISSIRSNQWLGIAALGLSIAVAIGLVAGARIAGAANVSGTMTSRDGKPSDRRQLHYENRVTTDIYIAPTKPDGSFSADLPPGFYDLRAERGLILQSKILVGTEDVNVGHILEPAPLDVRKPFEREGVAEALVQSPAPATANTISGRPLEAMRGGHESVAQMGAPVGTPAPQNTPLGEGEPTPAAEPSPSGLMPPPGGY